MSNSKDFTYNPQEHKNAVFYRVLKRIFHMKKNGLIHISALEIQKSLYKPYFPIPLKPIEDVLEEMYNGSILIRWEYENGVIKYELNLK